MTNVAESSVNTASKRRRLCIADTTGQPASTRRSSKKSVVNWLTASGRIITGHRTPAPEMMACCPSFSSRRFDRSWGSFNSVPFQSIGVTRPRAMKSISIRHRQDRIIHDGTHRWAVRTAEGQLLFYSPPPGEINQTDHSTGWSSVSFRGAALNKIRPTCAIVTTVKGGPPRFRFDPSPRRNASNRARRYK